jgi:hypothetical protein
MLKDLSDAELGRIVRDGPLWPMLLEMENKKATENTGAKQDSK